MVTVSIASPVTPDLSPEQIELIKSCIRLDCTVTPPATPHEHSLLRHIHAGKVWYIDIGTKCSCAAVALFKFGDEGYTLCKHGLVSIGMLRRDRP